MKGAKSMLGPGDEEFLSDGAELGYIDSDGSVPLIIVGLGEPPITGGPSPTVGEIVGTFVLYTITSPALTTRRKRFCISTVTVSKLPLIYP
jgi:hypothetical protein